MTLSGFTAKSALRNRRRSLLTILSIAFSLLLLTLMMAVWRGFYLNPGTPAGARRLMVRNRTSLTFPLPAYYQQKIAAVPGVEAVAPALWFGGIYKNHKPQNFFAQIGTDPDTFFKVYPDYGIPPAEWTAWRRDRAGCVVDARLLAQHQWHLGQHLFIQGTIFPVTLELTIDGVFHAPPGFEAIYFNQKYLQKAMPPLASIVGMYDVLTSSSRAVSRVGRTIDAMFQNSPAPTRSETERQFFLSFVNMLGNIKAFILAISMAVVFAILLVSANTMAMSIRERIREVAVLKTLGFTQRGVVGLFVGEAVAIALLGGVLGAFGAAGLLAMAGQSPQGAILKTFAVTPGIIALALGVAVVVGLVSAALPAWRAAQHSIVEGLRHAG
ncbi:MAG: ABC transporter permease [Terriglobales bacterium]